MTIVTLLSDFGTADSSVAEMKAVLLSRKADLTVVDITHEISPGDVRAGQYLLSRSWKYFPRSTIHVAVIDPGVGTERRAIAAESEGHRFLAPDNGLLSFLPAEARFVSILVPPDASPTFHGRDVFAPAAATLASGDPIDALGSSVSRSVRAPLPVPHRDGTTIIGEVIYVDRFGTLISNIVPAAVEAGVRIRVGDVDVGPLQRTFADAARGALVAFTGSGGTVEIAVRDGSAARLLGVGVGAEVRA